MFQSVSFNKQREVFGVQRKLRRMGFDEIGRLLSTDYITRDVY